MSFSIKLVQNSVRNLAVARNWRQNTLRNCRFACVKNVKKTSTRINILKILPSAYEKKKAQLQIDLHWFVWSIISNKLPYAS